MSEQKKLTFFEKLHTERYTWHDFFLVPVVIVILFLFLEQILGEVLMIPLKAILDTNDSFIQIFLQMIRRSPRVISFHDRMLDCLSCLYFSFKI